MKLKLEPEDRIKLKALQRSVKDRWKYIRITTILLLDDGFSVEKISQMLGIDDNTVYEYLQNYKDLEIEKFLNRDYSGYSGKLNNSQIQQLEKELDSKLYTTTKEVCEWVKKEILVEYREKGMAKLLHRIGFSYKKTKQVPCEANAEKQKEFLEFCKNQTLKSAIRQPWGSPSL